MGFFEWGLQGVMEGFLLNLTGLKVELNRIEGRILSGSVQ
jgi:hypothetical protein